MDYGVLSFLPNMSMTETLVRWAYRILRLEYELYYAKTHYQFMASATQRKRAAFEFVGKRVLAHSFNVLRKALGYEKLSCWGVVWKTGV